MSQYRPGPLRVLLLIIHTACLDTVIDNNNGIMDCYSVKGVAC